MKNKIAIIGGGNLGTAIAEGLLKSQFISANKLIVTKRNVATIHHLADLGVHATDDNAFAIQNATWIIFAVKPFQIQQLLTELAPYFKEHHRIISVITGISITEMEAVLPLEIPVFRAMPNTAISIQESITCISQNKDHDKDTQYVLNLFDQLGKAVLIDEKHMNAATVLGACGIAYAMRFIRANIQGGIEIGFDANTASLIVEQTVKGAAQLLLTNGLHPEQEIDKVTTPKGCTITGLNEMEHQGFSSSLIRGILASFEKIG